MAKCRTKSALVNASVVIVAHDVNLSVFNPVWLVREGVLEEAELDWERSIFMPSMIQIHTRSCEFSVFPNRLQLTFPPDGPHLQPEILKILGTIVAKLPHIPYSALGMNLDYLITPIESEFVEWNQRVFGAQVASNLGGVTDRYGSYYSTNAINRRLRTTCRPMRLDEKNCPPNWGQADNQEVVKIDLNYHMDLDKSDSNSVIFKSLGEWDIIKQHADGVIESIGEL